MKTISFNLNGIRSAARKGALTWLREKHFDADFICVQELKAQESDLEVALHLLEEYQFFLSCAQKKGYSGVGLYTRHQPDQIIAGYGDSEFDQEGRYIRCDFGALSIISVYCPSGSSSPERQAAKLRFMKSFFEHLRELKASGREYILCGDWNIAHREIDLKNWKSNQKNSGFLPEERAWLDAVFEQLNYVDVFRQLDSRPEQYTWWSARGQARAKNVGWRIDYQIATPQVAQTAKSTHIETQLAFSDHAPLIIEYDYALAG